jgi:hypothetical protein
MSSIYGLSYKGGYVFDYDQSSQTGKVIAPMDVMGWQEWNHGNSGSPSGNQYGLSCTYPPGNWNNSCQCSQAIVSSSGESNTAAIVSHFGCGTLTATSPYNVCTGSTNNPIVFDYINWWTDVDFVTYYDGTYYLGSPPCSGGNYYTLHWPDTDTTRLWQPDGNGGMEPIVTGYSDWYLPSVAEWQNIYSNIISQTTNQQDAKFKYGFWGNWSGNYWTSNEAVCNSLMPVQGKSVQVQFLQQNKDPCNDWNNGNLNIHLNDRESARQIRMARSFSE